MTVRITWLGLKMLYKSFNNLLQALLLGTHRSDEAAQ